MNCYKCKHPNLHGSNFCEKCGADLKKPPPKVNPVRPYTGYTGYQPPSGGSPPPRPGPAPRPTPAPRPQPAGQGYSPPPSQASPPQSSPPRRAPSPLPASKAPIPSKVDTEPSQHRRLNPVVSPKRESQAPPPATPRREPLPFGRLSGEKGHQFPLRYDVNLIGRPSEGVDPQVDLSSADTSGTVSRRHARIGKDDSSIFIEDLGSSNGTRHNGQTLREGMQAPLEDGDKLVFGDLVFTFHLVSSS